MRASLHHWSLATIALATWLAACSTTDPGKASGTGGDGDDAGADGADGLDGSDGADGLDGSDGSDGRGGVDCESPPTSGTVSTDPTCEYVPEPSGNPFSARIEWSMAHEMVDPSDPSVTWPAYSFGDEPDLVGVFQAPAVSQATDDNGDGVVDGDDTPDIAILTGDEFAVDDGQVWSALRLISGDGGVFDTVVWSSFTNSNGTDDYAPFLFSGVAMADLDLDGQTEVVTTVIGDSSGACYPASYGVSTSGQLTLEAVGTRELWCHAYDYVFKGSHAPALADLDNDGVVEAIFGRTVFSGGALDFQWEGTGGRGWSNSWFVGADGYWNSGFHSFAHDLDGDGVSMEVVSGSTVYDADGDVWCELGRYSGSTWVPADDGYPAVADLARFSGSPAGEPEIVITGNQYVSVYRGVPDSSGRCVEVDSVPNDPYDTSIGTDLPAHPDCDTSRRSFGGQPTIADFNGDGTREIGVAGACWFTIYDVTTSGLQYYAMTQTRDWSSASTGATVFDFNGDGTDEVVFSDEDALYVWQIDSSSGLRPFQRVNTVLQDDNHKSWTIHEYPIVADVDGDGKAEILVVNSPRPDFMGEYGLYVLGAADDDWVSARPVWNQHAYSITNIEDDFSVGLAAPNYAPYTSADYNSFRVQAPGAFGALAAADLTATAEVCQAECGDPATVWVQVENGGAYITAAAGLQIGLYGEAGGTETLLATTTLSAAVPPGVRSSAVELSVPDWASYDRIFALVDDPASTAGSTAWGAAKECDEDNNGAELDLSGLCE